MIAKDCTERLSAVALSVGLIILRSKCVSGQVCERVLFFFFFSQIRHRNTLTRDCVGSRVGRRRKGTRHGNVYRSVREKQGIVVYRQHVLQTVASLTVVSLVLRGHDLLKISNEKIPIKKPHFRYGEN